MTVFLLVDTAFLLFEVDFVFFSDVKLSVLEGSSVAEAMGVGVFKRTIEAAHLDWARHQ